MVRVLLLVLQVAAAAATCLLGQSYGTAAQRGAPQSTNVRDAKACQMSCLSQSNCRYFTYDTSTTDCWLMGEVMYLQQKDSAISGPSTCLQEEEEGSTEERLSQTLINVAEMVHEHTTDEEMRKTAQHVQWSCENKLLRNEKYTDIAALVTHLSDSIITVPEKLVEVSERGAVLTADDLQWLAKNVAHANVEITKAETVNPEDAEAGPIGGIGGIGGSPCATGKVACDVQQDATVSFGAGVPWTNAEVKYCFDATLAYSSRQAIECAIGKISGLVPGIKFIDVGYSKLDHCASQPAIYMQSNGRRSGGGCWSDIGMSSTFLGIGMNQKLNLQSPGCDNCGTATHEILHSLGMAHEQSRPDRDDYITIVWNNVKAGMDSQFTKNPKADTQRPYDIMSIMHYAKKSFTVNGADTILVKPKGFELYTSDSSRYQFYRLGQRMGMSRQDQSQLGDLYGCSRSTVPKYLTCVPSQASSNAGFLAVTTLSNLPIFSDAGVVILIAVIVAAVICVGGFCFCSGGGSAARFQRYERF